MSVSIRELKEKRILNTTGDKSTYSNCNASQACCDHIWAYTGKEKDESVFIFWKQHKKEFRCRKCHAKIC